MSASVAEACLRARVALLSCMALLAACASVSRGEWRPEQLEQVTAVERALESGDLGQARAAFERLVPRRDQSFAAQALERRIAARELEPFEPAFVEVQAAIAADDDELARSILNFALARQPRGAALELARRLEGVLEGRALLRQVTLTLEVLRDPAAPPERPVACVRLVARNDAELRISLQAPGASLDYLSVELAPNGVEQRAAQRSMVDALEDLRLKGGETRVVELDEVAASTRGLIALRGAWRLSATSGLLRVNGFELPAQSLSVQSADWESLDPRLPSGSVAPAELADYLARGAPSMPGLLERAVRIAPERRDEALDALTPVLLERPLIEIGRAAPALRWLSGERFDDGFGEDGPRCRQWLSARAERRRSEDSASQPQLLLPERR